MVKDNLNNQDIKKITKFVENLEGISRDIATQYIHIPNKPDIAAEVIALDFKYGSRHSTISDRIEELRTEIDCDYFTIQDELQAQLPKGTNMFIRDLPLSRVRDHNIGEFLSCRAHDSNTEHSITPLQALALSVAQDYFMGADLPTFYQDILKTCPSELARIHPGTNSWGVTGIAQSLKFDLLI
jgi:hypothetical protein